MYKDLLEDLKNKLAESENTIQTSFDELAYYQQHDCGCDNEDEMIDEITYQVESITELISDLQISLNELL